MFDKISVGIKTILRDDKLFHVINSLREYPGIQMIIADDGILTLEKLNLYNDLVREGHVFRWLGYDSGFGHKSNFIASQLKRPYLLVGSDDFDFSETHTQDGIRQLQHVLETYRTIDIASGRVNDRVYEFNLRESNGVITEIPIGNPPGYIGGGFAHCDLTVNYSLIRKEVFEHVCWDEDVKIGGGEHGSFFLDAKHAGFKTVYVPGVNINTLKTPDSVDYRKLRNRAADPARPCFERRGVKKYILGTGEVDYDSTYSS